jgi:competence protein ComEC
MKKKNILLILICCNLLAWSVVFDLVDLGELEVNVFDIGQGDSIFIETKNGYQILIDGGPTDKVLEKLGQKMFPWDRTIDLVILTHPDHDHIAGLIEVLKRYKVNYVLWNGLLKENGECEEWENVLKDKKINNKVISSGNQIQTPELYFDVLYPFEKLKREEVKDFNDTSLVLRLIFNETSFLFMGDLSSLGENDLLEKGIEIDSDVLKVGHHGSKSSSSDEFIAKVNPIIGLISVGRDNRYNHPSEKVLEVLNKYDINVLRTDLNGDIEIISDGKNIKIN